MSVPAVVSAAAPGLPDATLQRVGAIRDLVKSADAPVLIDALLYLDAVVTVAREKRATDIAREASRTRIEAVRRLGELILAADDPVALENVIPSRFLRCEEVAQIPKRLFDKAIARAIAEGAACSIPWVIRMAKIASLKSVEKDIYLAYDDSYWIAEGGKRRTHIHHGGLDEARRRLGLKSHPGAVEIDAAYAQARMAASQLSRLGQNLSGDVRKLVSDAELAQGRVAELLDAAIRAAA